MIRPQKETVSNEDANFENEATFRKRVEVLSKSMRSVIVWRRKLVEAPTRDRIWKKACTAWRISCKPRVDHFNKIIASRCNGERTLQTRLLATKYEVTKNKDQSVVVQIALTQKRLNSGLWTASCAMWTT